MKILVSRYPSSSRMIVKRTPTGVAAEKIAAKEVCPVMSASVAAVSSSAGSTSAP